MLKENKWRYEEMCFAEIDLSPLKQGQPARTFVCEKEDENKRSGWAITIYKGKKDPSKYYVKVEMAFKNEEGGES